MEEKNKLFVLLCKCLKTVSCILIVQRFLQIYGLHTNANQNLALMCEVSLFAEQRGQNKDISKRASDKSEIMQ